MCICGNPYMVPARREIRHSGIMAAINPPFGNSGGQKSFILEFWWPEIRHSGILVAGNLSFPLSLYMYSYIYIYIYI